MFSKILIANRGEIAIRIMRACRELGVASVAVYSEADANSPHVAFADEAIRIGPAPASESYLRGERIIAAALDCGAQAIHPGYGFLSEREWFARAVGNARLAFIGPTADAIARMGSKTAARTLAESAGVPVVPGTTDAVGDADRAQTIAGEMGFPVLLKAAAGGGGKGMRLVASASELEQAYDAASREALASFGDDAIYVEKYIVRPRHVEIQILGDTHGNIIHLGERECSIQRRHQKMIEEAPSIAVNEELRSRMGETAVRAARAAGYTNAGTCEFLLDDGGQFYFLEMNTRIQVEHPVTELVTGVDLVQWQIRIAAGEKLTVKQSDVVPRGWALECRITSESPADGFLPSTGRVTQFGLPSGPGVRWDGGIEVGTEVTTHYDPMLAKLIVWGPDRQSAIARMERALRELVIVGVDTSREFHLRVMRDAEFISGAFDVQWLERRLSDLLDSRPNNELARVAAIVAVLAEGAGLGSATPQRWAAQGHRAGSEAGALREGWPRTNWNDSDPREHA